MPDTIVDKEKFLEELAKTFPFKPYFSDSTFTYDRWIQDVFSKKRGISSTQKDELLEYWRRCSFYENYDLEKKLSKIRPTPKKSASKKSASKKSASKKSVLEKLILTKDEIKLIKDFREGKVTVSPSINEENY